METITQKTIIKNMVYDNQSLIYFVIDSCMVEMG
jgi:hypothetical protein